MPRFIALIPVMLLVVLAGCVSEVSSRGYVLNEESLQAIKPGVSDRQQVFQALGSPSSSSDFEVERWHYIGRVVKQKSVLDPKTLEQEVVTVQFDRDGKVATVERKNLDDAEEIDITDRETPTRGHSIGALEQIIGNFGRFNQTQQDVATE